MKGILGKKVGMTQIFDENGYEDKKKEVNEIIGTLFSVILMIGVGLSIIILLFRYHIFQDS